jgi:hypothetical protein
MGSSEMNLIYLAVLSVVILLAGLLIGGAYSIVPVSNPNGVGTFVVNRYTGHIWLCNGQFCRTIPNQQQVEPPAN